MCGEPLPLWQGSQPVANHRCSLLHHLTGHSAGARGVLEVLKLPLELPGCLRRWDSVPEQSRFPEGFCRPPAVALAARRPMVLRDTRHLLRITFVAFSHRLDRTWGSELHCDPRRTFATMGSLSNMLCARMSSPIGRIIGVRMPCHGGVTVAKTMTLSSGIESSDFDAPLPLVRGAFDCTASSHDCWLFGQELAAVIDGKRCVWTFACNERGSGSSWHGDLGVGFLQGCTRRPVPGSRYCEEHAGQCTVAPQECSISAHRERVASEVVRLQYLVNADWMNAEDVPPQHIRACLLGLPRAQAACHPG